MTTVIDESFNQRCSVSDDKYGYEPAAPKEDSDPYGYGDGAPAANNDDNSKYGYGDGGPDTANSAAIPDDAAKYGYGDDDNAASPYGYGDTSDNIPLGNRSTHSSGSSDSVEHAQGDDEGEVRRRRERPRRRGSVTKYSLEATEMVQQDHQDSLQPQGVPPTPTTDSDEITLALKESGSRTPIKSRKSSEHSASYMSEDDDGSVDEMSCEGQDATDKKKKKKRFGRFRIGRNRSGMSTESAASVSSHKSKD